MLNVNAVSLDRKEKTGSLTGLRKAPDFARRSSKRRARSPVGKILFKSSGNNQDGSCGGKLPLTLLGPARSRHMLMRLAPFLESLSSEFLLFDRILSDDSFRRVPLRGRGVVVTTGASGQNVTKDR